jgi:hypothetical protein
LLCELAARVVPRIKPPPRRTIPRRRRRIEPRPRRRRPDRPPAPRPPPVPRPVQVPVEPREPLIPRPVPRPGRQPGSPQPQPIPRIDPRREPIPPPRPPGAPDIEIPSPRGFESPPESVQETRSTTDPTRSTRTDPQREPSFPPLLINPFSPGARPSIPIPRIQIRPGDAISPPLPGAPPLTIIEPGTLRLPRTSPRQDPCRQCARRKRRRKQRETCLRKERVRIPAHWRTRCVAKVRN